MPDWKATEPRDLEELADDIDEAYQAIRNRGVTAVANILKGWPEELRNEAMRLRMSA